MRIRRLPLTESEGHLLLHNLADGAGRKLLAKGTPLGAAELARLRNADIDEVEVGILEAGDVGENEAAERIAKALTDGAGEVHLTRAAGGRVNLHSAGTLLYVDKMRLLELNLLQGVTLATRPPLSVIGTGAQRSEAATLKIIPFALPESTVREAEARAQGLLRFAPLRAQRVALLVVADAGNRQRVTRHLETPTRQRLKELGSVLVTVRGAGQHESEIAAAARELLAAHDALIVGGQTSIMDLEDSTLRGLREAAVEIAFHGVPVEPGNLMAMGYAGEKWVLCAPGCAKSLQPNVVDLVLPRLLAGEQISARDAAAMGLGGLL